MDSLELIRYSLFCYRASNEGSYSSFKFVNVRMLELNYIREIHKCVTWCAEVHFGHAIHLGLKRVKMMYLVQKYTDRAPSL